MPGTLRAIQNRGYLIAGVDPNTLLLSYEDPRNGTFRGFEVDILHQIAQAIFGDPNRIVFVALSTAQRFDAVEGQAGVPQVDVVADAITVNCARVATYRDAIRFSELYLDRGQRILVPADSNVQQIDDLRGQRVCATATSTAVPKIESAGAIPYTVESRIDCLVALQRDQVSAIVSDETILAGFRAQDPFTRIVGASLESEPYAMAVAKGDPDLLRLVNGVLEQMRSDGMWLRLYGRWLEPYLGTGSQPVADYVNP
jgi:polar amino acid transport system substrate-binding protein